LLKTKQNQHMKNELLPALRLTFALLVVLVVLYPLSVWCLAQLTPHRGAGEVLTFRGKTVGFKQVGQSFTQDAYFNSRPSAVNYNAAGSGGSNKGPSNAEYLAQVKARIDTFRVHNPTVALKDIPAELVTASGSGLDPHLSPRGALVQVPRIARVRGIEETRLRALVQQHTQTPLAGVFGPAIVQALELNIALDTLK
jgi:potassium-transporting ATPase KdpC subunit